jgi:adenylate cyclase
MHNIAHRNAIRSQQREVTLLFADLRGFTELAASLEMDPLVCELLAHVMDCLTEAVIDHDGLVVDYCGDGLVAMWNAPAEQPDHPELACRAALGMLETLPGVASDWAGLIQADLRLGIGIHTGNVQVGNAGSTRQTKYGPRGPNVHLASRVEAATKALRLPLLATTTTVQRLSNRFATNRICRARMPGLRQPVDLYAVRLSTNDDRLSSAWQLYDEALRHFEQGRYEAAADILASTDARGTTVPWRFLADEVQRELGRQQRRRSTDTISDCRAGIITLSMK